MGRHDDAMQRVFLPKNLIGDSTSDVLRENFYVIGKYLDACEVNANVLRQDFFPDQCQYLLENYETTLNLPGTGDTDERRNKITTALRARGGLSDIYFTDLGNKQGEGRYTVSITEGTGAIGFKVAKHSPLTSPMGPATLLPGRVYSAPFGQSCYLITVAISGISYTDKELESMYERLKPAHTKWQYVYTPVAPVLLTPADESTDISIGATFTWSPPGGVSLADTYRIQVSTVEDFSSTVIDEAGITTESYKIDTTPYLDLEQLYYWRVSATNIAGTSEWSDIWELTTFDGFFYDIEDTYIDSGNPNSNLGGWYHFSLTSSSNPAGGTSQWWPMLRFDDVPSIDATIASATFNCRLSYGTRKNPVYLMSGTAHSDSTHYAENIFRGQVQRHQV